MKRILVAGIGNIFFGDDAFGCEVANALMKREWPEGVRVVDFGIKSYDLAFALTDGCDAAILIDAAPRGEPPGTIYLLELDINQLAENAGQDVNAHSMNPVAVLQLARALGGQTGALYLVGCEPEKIDIAEGAMGLSETVLAAIPQAVEMIESLVRELLQTEPKLIQT